MDPQKIIKPTAIHPGDAIGIVAPAGPIQQRDALDRGIGSLEKFGFRVRFNQRVLQSWRYLAGDDSSRAEELMCHFEDPEVRAIIALRGGYGCARLIPLLNQDRLGANCKVFTGFSDLTTLHFYFFRRFGWSTIHGPMATSPALADSGPVSDHLFSLWTDPDYMPTLSFPELESWHGGVCEGILVGGCLSIMVASLGTPYQLDMDEKILFLEDLGEAPYRIDRMLTQLWLAGMFRGVRGLLLGSFQDCAPSEGGYTVEETLREVLGKLSIPTIARFPAGHGSPNWALPLGLRVRLDADGGEVRFLEAAVRGR